MLDSRVLFVISLLCIAAESKSEQTEPSIELLEFLGAWQEEDGTVIELELFETDPEVQPRGEEPEWIDAND